MPASAKIVLPDVVTNQNKPATTKIPEALASYKKDRLENYAGGFQGKKHVERKIDDFDLPDVWLHEFNFTEIKKFIDHWRGRPISKKGKPCTQQYARKQICEFVKFLNWVDNTYPEFQLPNIDSIDRTVRKLSSDVSANAVTDKSFAVDDLKEIFRTAQPLTQLIIGLGLNCCSGPGELGRFKVSDFHFSQPHPHANLIHFDQSADWLITTRYKTHSHSEALLWPWVA